MAIDSTPDSSDSAPDTSQEDGSGTGDEETFDPERAKAKITKANSEAANLRRRVRELEAAETKLKELEDANKSEGQKALEEREAAQARANKAEQELLRLTVAMEKGLTPAQAKRLVGSTLEELEADADDLLETFGPPKRDDEPRRPGDRPRPAHGASGDDADPDDGFDSREMARKLRSKGNRF